MKSSSVMPARILRLQEDFKELDKQKAQEKPQQARVYFKDLHAEIQERKMQIESLQTSQNRLIEIDERGKATVALENKGRAHDIAAKLRALREKNDINIGLLEAGQDISRRYNVPLDEMHQFNLSIPALEREIEALDSVINNMISLDPVKFSREKDNKYSPMGQEFALLNRSREALKNHREAEKELNELLGGIS